MRTVNVSATVSPTWNASPGPLAPASETIRTTSPGRASDAARTAGGTGGSGAIETGAASPQVTIRAKFVEVDQNDVRALGFNWYLGNTLLANGNVGLQAGTAPSYNGNPTTANPPGVFPNPLVDQATTDTLLTGGLRNPLNAPTLGTLTGILTDPQFRMAVQAIEQRDNSDVINAPEEFGFR